jgi:hypothetical protein
MQKQIGNVIVNMMILKIEKDVRQIKTLQGKISGVEIGKIYGVNKKTVCDIFKGRS